MPNNNKNEKAHLSSDKTSLKQYLGTYLPAFIGGAIVLFVGMYAIEINRHNFNNDMRRSVAGALNQVHARLSGNINSNMMLVKGLVASIALEPDISQEKFSKIAKTLFKSKNQLRNIGAAPDLVISLMYPMEGNEKAIGLDYQKNPAQREAALQAKNLGEFVLAGPVNLIQGGQGFIGRMPVFIEGNSTQPDKFWGLISTVINVEKLYQESGLLDESLSIEVAIKGKDGKGADGDQFLGRPDTFTNDPVIVEVSLPYGSWQMAATPKGGWPVKSDNEGLLYLLLLIAEGLTVIPMLIVGRLSLERRKSLIEAEKANNSKSEFLSAMSHELRTPLNAVLGFAQVLKLNPHETLTENQKDATQQIIKGGSHLLDLINDVLNLSQIEAGHLSVDIEPVKIKDLIDECLPMIDNLTHTLGVTILADDLTQAVVQADHRGLKQVLFNLLSNAVKYNRVGGKVFVSSADTDDGMYRISVADTGRGISKDLEAELFKPFSRLGEENSNIQGTGIGLTITQRLIEAMDGNIGFESTQGVGSTFWVELPLSAHTIDRTQKTLIADADLLGRDDVKGNILYIEDNFQNASLMEAIISNIDKVKLDVVGDAEMGIATAIQTKPDLILMDINLPGMNGFEALGELRRHEETRDIPVIAISGDAMTSQIEKGLEAGFLTYLTKPFNVTQLHQAISNVLSDKAK